MNRVEMKFEMNVELRVSRWRRARRNHNPRAPEARKPPSTGMAMPVT